jgi:hypothetical protein
MRPTFLFKQLPPFPSTFAGWWWGRSLKDILASAAKSRDRFHEICGPAEEVAKEVFLSRQHSLSG